MALCTLATLTALSGCGPGGQPDAAPSTMSDAEILAIGKQVADCIRDNGVPDFPDLVVVKGRLTMPDGVGDTLEQKYSQQVLDQAQQSCQALMDRLPESAIRDEEETNVDQDPPIDVETMRKLAQCLRENGIPEWPDPKADGTFPLAGTPLDAEGKSQRVLAAGEKCKEYWTGSIRYS